MKIKHCAALCIVMCHLLLQANFAKANGITPGKPIPVKFKLSTQFTLAPNDQFSFFRVNEHQQITYTKIHATPVQYFYDTYNAFPYYDTLIPPHDEPLTVSVHTFLHNDQPNSITAELISMVPPADEFIKGHQLLKQGYSAIMRNYLKETKNEQWVHFFKSAKESFEQGQHHLWTGIAANQLASEFQNQGDLSKSLIAFQQAINHFIVANQPAYRWFSEGRLGLAEWRLNRLDEAMQRFKNVAHHGEQLDLVELVRTAHNNIGLMHWAKREIHQAIDAFQQSLRLANIAESELLNQDITKIKFEDTPLINNLALAYESLGQTEKAKALFETILLSAQSLNDTNQVFISHINMASLLRQKSQLDLALSHLKKAEQLERTEKQHLSPWWLNQLQMQLGNLYQSLALDDLALHHYLKALEMSNPESYKRQHIDVLLSLTMSPNTQPAQKLEWVSKAEQLLKGSKLKVQEAKVIEFKGQQASIQNKKEQAIALFKQAKDTLHDQHRIIQTSQLDLQMAQNHQSLGQHQQAIEVLENALSQLPQSMDRVLANQLSNALSYSQWQSGNHSQALQNIQHSVDALNALIPFISHSKTQQQLKIQVDETLALYALLFQGRQKPEQTLSQIKNTQSLWQRAHTQPSSNQSTALFQEIENISFALENKRLSDDTRQQLEGEIIQLNNQLDYLNTLTASQTHQFDWAEFQKQLPKDAVVVQFMTSQYGSLAWWISRNQIQLKILNDRNHLSDWVEKSRLTVSDHARFNEATRALSEHLFEPLTQLDGVKHLHVIVDEPLNVLPMAALPLPGTTVPLIERLNIQYHNSLTFDIQQQPKKMTQAVYFANPVHHRNDPRLPANTNTEGFTEFATLMGTAHEVSQIQSFIPGQIKQGFAANKATFKNTVSPQILHMATHAFFNEAHPDLSALVLSAYDDAGNPQPAMLRASEIRNMERPHELVVLSGCETGLTSGNGLTGLTMSFLQAGAKNLVASLWQVDDRVTSQMMALFYQNLNQGHAVDVALRRAQLHIKNQPRTRHPKFWAGWFHMTP